MISSPYSEDHLVEQPAIQIFADLGWQTAAVLEETVGPGTQLGRRRRDLLLPRLLAGQIDVEAAQ